MDTKRLAEDKEVERAVTKSALGQNANDRVQYFC